MSGIDLVVVVAYVAGVSVLGALLGARSRGLKGYFLGESDVPVWAVMISIVATETSTVTFLSVPGVAYRGNFTYLQLAFGYIIGRVLVTVFLLPAYFRGSILTAYQLLQERFGGPTRTLASLLFLAARSLGDGLRLFLAATVLEHLTGWSTLAAVAVVALATVVYTFLGGMKAVVWTDVIQFCVYILGASGALFILAHKLPGGWPSLIETARAGGKLQLLDFRLDLTLPFTFWAGVVGGMVLNTATHGVDQMMVQRYLAARSRGQAAFALVASGFVVLAQFALFLFIGASLWVFYGAIPAARPLGSDEVFTYFIVHYLPPGMMGLLVAAIFSAAMGSLAGSLNSASATIVNDLYRPLFPQADEKRLMIASRGAVVVWGAVLAVVASFARRLDQSVVVSALTVASFVSGILLGVFLLGLFARRVGQGAALVGVLVGAAAVTFAKFGTPLAWPYFATVGALSVVLAALAASLVLPRTESDSSSAAGV